MNADWHTASKKTESCQNWLEMNGVQPLANSHWEWNYQSRWNGMRTLENSQQEWISESPEYKWNVISGKQPVKTKFPESWNMNVMRTFANRQRDKISRSRHKIVAYEHQQGSQREDKCQPKILLWNKQTTTILAIWFLPSLLTSCSAIGSTLVFHLRQWWYSL